MPCRHHQRGLSLVELLVGIAVGLIVTAAATLMLAQQLAENRRLLLAAQLQQELRGAAELISRELRRSGALPDQAGSTLPSSSAIVWTEGTPHQPLNPLAAQLHSSDTTRIDYAYAHSDVEALNLQPLFIRKHPAAAKLQMAAPGGATQDLTDERQVKITRFEVLLAPAAGGAEPVRLPCPTLCPDGGTGCWPVLRVMLARFVIEGQSALDSSIQRAISGQVRVRGERLEPQPGAAGGALCPA
jgi:prepilin peptidase dependent protein B